MEYVGTFQKNWGFPEENDVDDMPWVVLLVVVLCYVMKCVEKLLLLQKCSFFACFDGRPYKWTCGGYES